MKNLFLTALLMAFTGMVFASKMQITVTYDQAKKGDSLFLEYYDTFFPRVIKPKLITAIRSDDGTYKFSVEIDGPVRFSVQKRLDETTSPFLNGITFSFDTILDQYYWEGEGELKIHISKRPGSAPQNNQPNYDFAYTFQGYRALQHRAKALSDSAFNRTGSTKADRERYEEPQSKKIHAGIAMLDSLRESLGDQEYQLLKADFVYQNPLSKLRGIREKMVDMSADQQEIALAKLDKFFDWGFDQDILANSSSYVYYWFERQKLGMSPVGKKFDADSLLDALLSGPQNLLTARMITYTIALGGVKDIGDFIPRVQEKIRDQDCITVVSSLDVRGEGKQMFDFELPDSRGKLVKLSDFKGKTVLIDFWYTGCGGCELYYDKVLSKVEKEMHGKNVEFIAISMDRGRDRWMKSIKSNRYTSELATNLYTGGVGFMHEIANRYGIFSYPTLIVVDKHGRISDFDSKELHVMESANLVNILNQVSTR